VLDSDAEGPEFKSKPRRCLRQTVHSHRASAHQTAKVIAAFLRVSRVAKNRDKLPNTLDNRAWATFTFYLYVHCKNNLLVPARSVVQHCTNDLEFSPNLSIRSSKTYRFIPKKMEYMSDNRALILLLTLQM